MTGNWQDHGNCKGVTDGRMYPARGESAQPAKALCADCPVKTECLTHALDNGETFGIWGGTSARERRLILTRRAGRPLPPINHGTSGGYQAHQRRREPACQPCKDAYAAQCRARTARAKDAA